MNLYIYLNEDSVPINHPLIESNLIALNINIEELPYNIKKFNKSSKPLARVYEIIVQEYVYDELSDQVIENWSIRDMTSEERTNKQLEYKEKMYSRGVSRNSIFDIETCTFQFEKINSDI